MPRDIVSQVVQECLRVNVSCELGPLELVMGWAPPVWLTLLSIAEWAWWREACVWDGWAWGRLRILGFEVNFTLKMPRAW
jgi:hypothetical protein